MGTNSVWFEAVLWQCRLQGVFAFGMVACVLFIAFIANSALILTRLTGVLTLTELGVVYVQTNLQYGTQPVMMEWHANVVLSHVVLLMVLLIGFVVMLLQSGESSSFRKTPPAAAPSYASTHKTD